MKIGLILECTPEGADLQVYSYFARQILGDRVDIQPSCAGNKKTLIQNAGKLAHALFAEGCERVLIIWDLWPRWAERKFKPSLAADRATITQSLRDADVTNSCVYLVGIDRMLETLLIVDGNAIAEVLNVPRGRPKPSHKRSPRRTHEPKKYLDGLFRDYGRSQYADYRHAKQIAEHIDVGRLERACPEFGQFRQSLSQLPCRPPLAWNP